MVPRPSSAAFSAKIAKEPRLKFIAELRRRLPEAGVFLVGGAVRDLLLGRPTKDFDLMVANVDGDRLAAALAPLGGVNLVGRDFGVIKFYEHGADAAVDIALPRTEHAGGSGGYRDFAVHSDPRLPIEDDLSRRDFTVNAIAWSFADRVFIDPFDGQGDLSRRMLRAVGDPERRFSEDFSRMLRCIRFSCQLGFMVEEKTWAAARRMAFHVQDTRDIQDEAVRVVPYEVIAKEMVKAFVADPVAALDLFEESGMLALLIPDLMLMRGCVQPKNHHSEGDVWTHTRLALSMLMAPAFRKMFRGEVPEPETIFAVLFHDVAKPRTAARKDDTITYYGHPDRGAEIAEAAARRLRLASVESADIDPERLGWLVKHHLLPNLLDLESVRPATLVNYFLADPVRGRRLLHLSYADASASLRPDGKPDLKTLRKLMAVLGELEKKTVAGKPTRLLTGEEVMDLLGLEPGPEIGRILKALGDAYLEEKIATREQAVAFVRNFERVS